MKWITAQIMVLTGRVGTVITGGIPEPDLVVCGEIRNAAGGSTRLLNNTVQVRWSKTWKVSG